MSHKSSSKPYKNSDFIRTLVSTQLLMELNLSEFIKSNQTIKLSKNYSLNKYSKDLDKTWIELLCMGEFDGEWNKNTFNEFISPIERQEGSKAVLENNKAIVDLNSEGWEKKWNDKQIKYFLYQRDEWRKENKELSRILNPNA